MNIYDIRKLVYGLEYPVPLKNGSMRTSINFDNAATTPILNFVLDEVKKFLLVYSSAHRGYGYKSKLTTEIYDNCRKVVGGFVNSNKEKDVVIFVKNTTDAINMVSNILYDKYKDGVIISTDMEHHSNDLPWRKFKLEYIGVDVNGLLILSELEKKLKFYKGKVKLVTISGASNVTGYKNPIHKIATIVHKYNAMIMVDGAQLVPHALVNMAGYTNDDYIDFLAFSGHKMYAPLGCGVLIGPKWLFKQVDPDYPGGGNVDIVTHNYVKWNESPLKNEVGSPNVVGAVAIASSVKVLTKIGMNNIENYERRLTEYAIKNLSSVPNIKLYCCGSDNYINIKKNNKNIKKNSCETVSIIPFNLKNVHHEKVAEFLSEQGAISVRDGCFCAHPYVQKLLRLNKSEMDKFVNDDSYEPGMVRISFGFYNTFNEIDRLVYYLKKIN